MGQKPTRYDKDQLGDEEDFDAEALDAAIEVFGQHWRPTAQGERPDDYLTTDKLMRQFNELAQGLCTSKQIHDALRRAGYRYEYQGTSFFWLVSKP